MHQNPDRNSIPTHNPETKRMPIALPGIHKLSKAFKAGIFALGVLSAPITAQALPGANAPHEQIDLSKVSDKELLRGVESILGYTAVQRATDRNEFEFERGIPVAPIRDRGASRLSTWDLDDTSPAQKLATLRQERADRIILVNKLKPYTDEAKRRQLSWGSSFEQYLTIPREPVVDSAEGKLAIMSNKTLLKQVESILGYTAVQRATDRNEFEFERGIPVAPIRDRGASRLSTWDLDDTSPAQKLATLRQERADRIILVNKLKPYTDEAKRRQLSWGSSFEQYLTIPLEPMVDSAEGKLATLSNKALWNKVEGVIGAAKAREIIEYSSENHFRDFVPSISENEAKIIYPYVREAGTRRLSWANEFRRFMVNIEQEKVEPGQKNVVEKKHPQNARISEFELKLHEQYGIKINYTIPALFSRHTGDTPTNVHLIDTKIAEIARALEKYPDNVVRKFKGGTITLVQNLKEKGHALGGVAADQYMVIDIDNDIYSVFHHELFHNFDYTDGLQGDNISWTKINPNGKKDYKYHSGAEAIIKGGVDRNAHFDGFATSYGKMGGADEDQADIAEALFERNAARNLYTRAKADIVLRKKIETLTGCFFDAQSGIFTRLLTPSEYQKITGFTNFEYYAKWSRVNSSGPTMGVEYWNWVVR